MLAKHHIQLLLLKLLLLLLLKMLQLVLQSLVYARLHLTAPLSKVLHSTLGFSDGQQVLLLPGGSPAATSAPNH